MTSQALLRWQRDRKVELDEILQAHASVGGTARGRRTATQQINHAFAVLLASQFQGFCRDLHSESVDHLVSGVPQQFQTLLRFEFTFGRQLDRHNAQSSALGSDFGRLGIEFWSRVDACDARNDARKKKLEKLNEWRNAIAHQNYDKVRKEAPLRLNRVKDWRCALSQLAEHFDRAMRDHLNQLLGSYPW